MENEDFGVLIVDDEPAVRDSLQSWFEKDGYRTAKAADAAEAMDILTAGSWEIVLLDIKMPGIDGMDLQKKILRRLPNTVVIMITAYASVETAVEALKAGAFDYVSKPIDPEELSHVVRRATEHLAVHGGVARLQTGVGGPAAQDQLIGESPEIKRILKLVGAASKSDVTVLIRGDRGTGKELVARLIHANSRRKFFPMIPVSCGSLGVSLLESELFGHEKSHLHGVQQERAGKVEMADGGTLFIDDVGAMDVNTQAALLGVIENKKFLRIGGTRPTAVDARIICATAQDLEQRAAEGLFRENLYHRISELQIYLPPLRERRSDVVPLADYFARKCSQKLGGGVTGISRPAMKALIDYDWPGNVRELENTIERAVAVSAGATIEFQDLPPGIKETGEKARDDSLEAVEKAHIAEVLEKTSWNISKASKRLGIDRTTLYSKIKKYGIARK